jgi:hypothetical protein
MGGIMTTEIVARAAGFDRDDDIQCITAGFAEFADGSGLGLLFQAATCEPDEQDVQLGMDTYCITTGDQRATRYGGLIRAELTGNELLLVFSREAGEDFDLDGGMKVRLDVDERALREFKEGFPQVVLVPWGRANQRPKLSGF